MLKKMKLDISAPEPSGSTSYHENGGTRRVRPVTVEEEEDADKPGDFAPGRDADYFVEEDDEGRFFGGGLTSEQKDILNIFDRAGGEGVQEDVSGWCHIPAMLMTD